MTSMPSHDPLVTLWQTAPKPDTRCLLEDLQRLKHLHQRHNRSVLAIVCGIAILLIFEEATGRVGSHGILSVTWTLAAVVAVVWQRRARCHRFDALTLDTVSLLKTMIRRAKSDLLVARCLYAGVPCGAVAGYLVAKLAGIGTSARTINPHLDMLQTAAGIAALVIMMVVGVILARSRRLQVQELSEKLRSIEADL
jgi:CDP-diglyceride synthetase